MATNGSSEDSDEECSISLIPVSEDSVSPQLELIKSVLFFNDEWENLHFIVLHRDADERAEMCKLITDHYGFVYDSLEKIEPYSIVLVSDECRTWPYSRDVFKFSYIDACMNAGQVLDVTKFLKTTSTEFCKGFDYMQIVYYKKYSWDNVPAEFRLTENQSDSDDSDSSVHTDSQVQKPKAVNKKTRCAYQRREKEAILRYIIANQGYDLVKGVKLWRDMEQADICPLRTWQSMKEHFLKTMSKELSASYFLNESQKKKFKEGLQRKDVN